MSNDIFDIILSPEFPSKYATGNWNLLTNDPKGRLHSKLFIGGVWAGLDLSGLYFDYCNFSLTQIISCSFYNARCKCTFNTCKFEDSSFASARFQRRGAMTVAFLRCSFIGAIWDEGYSFIDCLFYDCDLTDVTVNTKESFDRTIFKRCLMSDALAERLKMLQATVIDQKS